MPDRVNVLLRMAAESFALSRHYEQMQYAIMAAMVAGIAALLSNREIIGSLHKVLRWFYLVVATSLLLGLSFLATRFLSLSIMQFHIAQTQVNVSNAIMSGGSTKPLPYPFDVDWARDPTTGIPNFTLWFVNNSAAYYFIYPVLLSLLIFGLTAIWSIQVHHTSSSNRAVEVPPTVKMP